MDIPIGSNNCYSIVILVTLKILRRNKVERTNLALPVIAFSGAETNSSFRLQQTGNM